MYKVVTRAECSKVVVHDKTSSKEMFSTDLTAELGISNDIRGCDIPCDTLVAGLTRRDSHYLQLVHKNS